VAVPGVPAFPVVPVVPVSDDLARSPTDVHGE
jgi:hypothetical protein